MHDGEIVRLNARLGTIGPHDLNARSIHHSLEVVSALLWEKCHGRPPRDPGEVELEHWRGGPCFGTEIVNAHHSATNNIYYESGVRMVGYFVVTAPGGYHMGRQIIELKAISTERALRAVS